VFSLYRQPVKIAIWPCLIAILGAIALHASHASAAPNWMVPPKPGLPAELSAKAEKTLTLNTKIAGISLEFSCTGISLDSALIEVEGKATGKALFSGCITKLNGVTSAVCEPFTGAGKGLIASNALKGQLLLHEGTTTLLKVSAVSGETFGTIKMGPECFIGENVPVIGPGLYVKDAAGEFEVEKATHLLEVGPLTELWAISKTAEHKATAGGSVAVSLAGVSLGQSWSGLGS
jgi:hypothetical protein